MTCVFGVGAAGRLRSSPQANYSILRGRGRPDLLPHGDRVRQSGTHAPQRPKFSPRTGPRAFRCARIDCVDRARADPAGIHAGCGRRPAAVGDLRRPDVRFGRPRSSRTLGFEHRNPLPIRPLRGRRAPAVDARRFAGVHDANDRGDVHRAHRPGRNPAQIQRPARPPVTRLAVREQAFCAIRRGVSRSGARDTGRYTLREPSWLHFDCGRNLLRWLRGRARLDGARYCRMAGSPYC